MQSISVLGDKNGRKVSIKCDNEFLDLPELCCDQYGQSKLDSGSGRADTVTSTSTYQHTRNNPSQLHSKMNTIAIRDETQLPKSSHQTKPGSNLQMFAAVQKKNRGVVSTLNQYEPELDSSASDDCINAPQSTTPMETIRKIY